MSGESTSLLMLKNTLLGNSATNAGTANAIPAGKQARQNPYAATISAMYSGTFKKRTQ